MREEIIILDFGSQYTQLIARRIRELKVYCEIFPFNVPIDVICSKKPKAIILSGGPQSVLNNDSPSCSEKLFDLSVPVLGICYGMQLMSKILGGIVAKGTLREYGRTRIAIVADSPLFKGIERDTTVWMSHGDCIQKMPPGFKTLAKSEHVMAAFENKDSNFYGLQFHPEVVHTKRGKQILKNFVFDIADCSASWTLSSFIRSQVELIKERVGGEKLICALSGGVDSTVAATLVHRAVGSQQTCIFVNNGLLRQNEYKEVLHSYKDMNLNVIGIDASERFLKALENVEDPEKKRKIIGNLFIDIFEEEARKIGNIRFLVQGTLYPDVIESVSVKGPSAVIKSHHNVGGLPEKMKLRLIEPLRELFKDEVRQVGKKLGLSEFFITRQPFPGPGLAVRMLGEVTNEKLEILRKSDEIVLEEIHRAGLYKKIWQAFAVLLPVKSVGIMGDERTYEYTIAVRAVHSEDGMTADWVHLPYGVLEKISSRIVNEVTGVNRVVYDISTKPPGTIEWE